MTKLSKEATAALTGLQGQPFGMVPEKIANELIGAGLALVANVQLSKADKAANKGNLPIHCTLEGLSFGKVDANESDISATGGDAGGASGG